jgi:hypothetical protein
MSQRRLKPRTAEADRALDGVLAALAQHGFGLPGASGRGNREALASALVTAAIDHEIRIRIDGDALPLSRDSGSVPSERHGRR